VLLAGKSEQGPQVFAITDQKMQAVGYQSSTSRPAVPANRWLSPLSVSWIEIPSLSE